MMSWGLVLAATAAAVAGPADPGHRTTEASRRMAGSFGVQSTNGGGGLGDRLVGLIATQLIAAKLGNRFFIDWRTPDITRYVTSEYFVSPELSDQCSLLRCVDRPKGVEDLLKKGRGTRLFDVPAICNSTLVNNHNASANLNCMGCINSQSQTPCSAIQANHEIAQFLYSNPTVSAATYYDDVLCMWQQLYHHTLRKTPYIAGIIDRLLARAAGRPLVGVQIRAGDNWIVAGQEYDGGFSSLAQIKIAVEKIRLHALKAFPNAVLYVTSDAPNMSALLANRHYIVYDYPVSHIDRDFPDHTKAFVDNILLAEHAQRLYISSYSNFGRVMAMVSPADAYSLTLEKLDKRSMVYKLRVEHPIVGEQLPDPCSRASVRMPFPTVAIPAVPAALPSTGSGHRVLILLMLVVLVPISRYLWRALSHL
jgi:hypothetical protein